MHTKWEYLIEQHDTLFRQAYANVIAARNTVSVTRPGDTEVARSLRQQGHFTELTEDALRKLVAYWRKQDDYRGVPEDITYTGSYSIPVQAGTVSVSSTVKEPVSVKKDDPISTAGFTELIRQYQTASEARALTGTRIQRHYDIPEEVERIGVLCDIHGPHRDKQATEQAVEFLHQKGLDCLVLNGDALDLTAVSRWPTSIADKASLSDELEDGRHLLRAFASYFDKAKLIWSFGNHEERMENYLIRRAPELFKVDGIDLPSLLHIDYNRWTIIDQKATLRAGDYYLIHGHETTMKSGGIAPAKRLYDQTGVQAIAGHFHRSSSYRFKRINGDIVKAYTVGCLCQLDPNYAVFNNWNHGFLYMEKRSDQWRIENYIIDNTDIFLSQ